jgi:hypothetical protein
LDEIITRYENLAKAAQEAQKALADANGHIDTSNLDDSANAAAGASAGAGTSPSAPTIPNTEEGGTVPSAENPTTETNVATGTAADKVSSAIKDSVK